MLLFYHLARGNEGSITILVPSFLVIALLFFFLPWNCFSCLAIPHHFFLTIICRTLYIVIILFSCGQVVLKKRLQVTCNPQAREIIPIPLFLLFIFSGHFLNKVLQPSILSNDFYLTSTLIHKQSTAAVEWKIRIFEGKNYKSTYCFFPHIWFNCYIDLKEG